MKPLKYTVAALAVIALASFTQSAKALAPLGDVILGVYDANDAALGSFELDLGSFSTVTATTDGSESWNLGTAVESTFSSDSAANLQFNIAASASAYGTAAGLAAKEIAFTTSSLGTYSALNQNAYTNIQQEYTEYGSGTSTTIPSGTAYVVPAGTGAFGTEVNANGGTGNYGAGSSAGSFLTSYPSDGTDVTFYTKTGTGTGDTTPVVTGTFVFSNVGGNDILTYDPAAVPEPSAYALGIVAVALFWVLKRRNSVA